jgi:hypothetical protein
MTDQTFHLVDLTERRWLVKSHHQASRFPVSVPLILCLFTCIPASTHGLGHAQPQESVAGTDLKRRIGVLIKQTLDKRQLITSQGTRVWAPVPPSPEIVQEIKDYGDRVVPILAEYLASGSLHERELALELLTYIDSPRIVEYVLLAARNDPEPSLRKQGLRYLAAQPWDVAQPILRHASEADPDPGVREFAEQAYEGHQGRLMESPSADFVRDRIARMMDYIVRRSEFALSDGVRIRIVLLADNDEIDEVKHYGDRAIPVLSEYLSEDRAEKYLAMRLLGEIGTSGIIEPLARVATKDASPSYRQTGLRWLTQAPWESAAPIIRQAANDDPDPMVRETARELLQAHRLR